MKLQDTEKNVLKKVADLDIDKDFTGAHSLRVNAESFSIGSTDSIKVVPRDEKDGINIYVDDNTVDELIHIPVVISESGIKEVVKNDFFIGKNARVVIIAGCGIDNCGDEKSEHSGIHSFYLGENSHVTYIENHYGTGKGKGDRVLNPVTNIFMKENSELHMESIQIGGVSSTDRLTTAILDDNATLVVNEKLLTTGKQYAKTNFEVSLNGENSSCDIVSRSVAKDHSRQHFISKIDGNAKCMGHSECDSIIMDEALVQATPEVTANHVDAMLIHEAAIGKIAGDQITKLMTLGLTDEEAEEKIINGFLH